MGGGVVVFITCASMLSVPIGANGFGRPSFPGGISIILESRKLLYALSEKIVSSNLIFLTLKSRAKKSLAMEDWLSFIVFCITEFGGGDTIVVAEEETRPDSGSSSRMKKI